MQIAVGLFKNPVSSQTDKLMAGTKFPDYLGLKHYKKAKKIKKIKPFNFQLTIFRFQFDS